VQAKKRPKIVSFYDQTGIELEGARLFPAGADAVAQLSNGEKTYIVQL